MSSPGTLLGVLTMGVVDNGLEILHARPFNNFISKRLILCAAVVSDAFGRSANSEKKGFTKTNENKR